MNRKLISVLLLLFSVASAYSVPRLRHVANSGHTSAINVLRHDAESGYLFSGGDDGSIRIWETDGGRIFKVLQISHLPVRNIAVNPTMSHVSGIVSNSLGSHYLTVWDWDTGEHVYSLPLPEAPLSIDYSPKGTYLVYSDASFKSVHVLQAETGRPLPYLTRGFGIVSAFAVSSSERSIVTYSPSGTVRYFEMRTGIEKETIRTESELEAISFSPDRRYLAGRNGNSLAYIDLVTGRTVATKAIQNIQFTSIHPESGDIVVFAAANPDEEVASVFETYGYENSDLMRKNRLLKKPTENITAICSVDDAVYSADSNGTIYRQGLRQFRPVEFARNQLAVLDDIHLGASIVLSTPSSILMLDSDYLYSADRTRSPTRVTIQSYPNPFAGETGIAESDGGQTVIFKRDGDYGELTVFDRSGTGRTYAGFTSPIRSAEIVGDSLLTLDRLGECRITDLFTGTTTFSYTSLGLRTVTFSSERTIIAGSSRSSRWNSTLLHLDPGTGETVPVNDTNIITFALRYDPVTRQLYSLGVESIAGKPRTVLKAHYGRTFDRSRTLISFPGEDLDATLALGRDGTVYTSLGDTGVRSILWGDILDFEDNGKLHRDLKIQDNWLISLNTDSSLTVWDIQTREKLLDFYIFDDYNWAAISSLGGFYTSSSNEKRMLFYRGETVVEREPDRLRAVQEELPEFLLYDNF